MNTLEHIIANHIGAPDANITIFTVEGDEVINLIPGKIKDNEVFYFYAPGIEGRLEVEQGNIIDINIERIKQ